MSDRLITRLKSADTMSAMSDESKVSQRNVAVRPCRVVLVGASNLTRAISTVIGCAQAALAPRQIDVYCALGHGRSYGQVSSIGFRSVPGIWQSELWPVLRAERKRQPDAGVYGLITDVGNDVAYGVEPKRIAEWVEFAARELHEHGARTIITTLPIVAIRQFTPWRFNLVRSILFPSQRMTLEEAVNRAKETDERVREIARKYACELVEPEPEWYGVDAIHLRIRIWKRAWPFILSHWPDEHDERHAISNGHVPVDLRRWLSIRMSSPSRWWLLGLPRGRMQPSVRLRDGTLVRLH